VKRDEELRNNFNLFWNAVQYLNGFSKACEQLPYCARPLQIEAQIDALERAHDDHIHTLTRDAAAGEALRLFITQIKGLQ